MIDPQSTWPIGEGFEPEVVLGQVADIGVSAGVEWGDQPDVVVGISVGPYGDIQIGLKDGRPVGAGVGLGLSAYPAVLTLTFPVLPTPGGASDSVTASVPVFEARDPNGKRGPAGYGSAGFTVPGTMFRYRIDFENDKDATAPAQEVVVTDSLSPNLDWTTFELSEISFGDRILTIPPGTQYYETTLPMTFNGTTFDVRVEAGIRLASGQVYLAMPVGGPGDGTSTTGNDRVPACRGRNRAGPGVRVVHG